MTGYGTGPVTCQFCGAMATEEDQRTKSWGDLHKTWCSTFVVLDLQHKLFARCLENRCAG